MLRKIHNYVDDSDSLIVLLRVQICLSTSVDTLHSSLSTAGVADTL